MKVSARGTLRLLPERSLAMPSCIASLIVVTGHHDYAPGRSDCNLVRPDRGEARFSRQCNSHSQPIAWFSAGEHLPAFNHMLHLAASDFQTP